MKELENLVIENKKRDFEPCSVEVVHFNEYTILTDEEASEDQYTS